MQVCYDSPEKWPLRLDASVLTIGAFDGVHRGHQALLRQAQRRAWHHGVPFVILTFDPPPRVVFENAPLLTPLPEKLRRLSAFVPDYVVVIPFDASYAALSAYDFVARISLVNPIEIWVGEDFRFGRNLEGNVSFLSKYFMVKVISKVCDENGEHISSTRIRELLVKKQIAKAYQLMGWHSLSENYFCNSPYESVYA